MAEMIPLVEDQVIPWTFDKSRKNVHLPRPFLPAPRPRDAEGHDAREEELAEEDEEEEHEVEAGVIAEGLVGGPEPAEEGEGDEEEGVDKAEAEHGALVLAGEEKTDAAQEVENHKEGVDWGGGGVSRREDGGRGGLTQPEVVEPLDHLLELHRNVHIDVLDRRMVNKGLTRLVPSVT